MNWNKTQVLLDQPLDPKHIVKPSGSFGPKGDYIHGWHAIAEANRIFGYDGWSYTVKSLEKVSLTEGTDSNGKPQWQAAYTCMVRVCVGVVTREDVGFGSGFSKQIGDAVEGATKEAVTDALKRALRTFGNPFGLALYDKTRANVGVPFDSADTLERLKTAVRNVNDEHTLEKLWNHQSVKDAISKMDEDHKAEIIKVHTDRIAKLSQKEAA